jgi:predicted  nucleic acid-binding Zn ribbon protein
MMFYQIYFGQYDEDKYDEAEKLIDYYLSSLLYNDQIGQIYYILSWKDEVIAYVCAQGQDALLLKHHSKWGKERLQQIKSFFGQSPVWKCNDDYSLNKTSWKGAPFLYISTSSSERNFFRSSNKTDTPVLGRGDNGFAIPLYRVPLTDEDRREVCYWRETYKRLDDIWIGSGEFEIPAYRTLCEPTSYISDLGRNGCLAIEKATGIPTYYRLDRYYGRKDAEEKKRRCPCCGKPWFVKRPPKEPGERQQVHEFDFMCKKCRLVSHCATEINLRYARIGEPRKGK